MIEPGKHVKYFLRNGMVLEGICEKDGGSEVLLKSLDGKSLMILHKPAEDIMMTKVVLIEDEVEAESAPAPALPEYDEPQPTDHGDFHDKAVAKLREVQQAEGNPELTEKSMAELREMVQDQDRKIIAERRREHFGTPDAPKMTQYSSPYTPMRTVGRKVVPRSAYQPGRLPNWVYGRPPSKGK